MGAKSKHRKSGKLSNRLIANLYQHQKVWCFIKSIGKGWEELIHMMNQKKK